MSGRVREIQAILKAEGYYAGEIDGIAGKLTLAAVKEAVAAGKLTGKQSSAVLQQGAAEPSVTDSPEYDSSSDKKFVFSDKSISRLEGVDDRLVSVVKAALQISLQDFGVAEGRRTKERQAEMVRKGASQTMKSNHLTGRAVDLVPIVDGKANWDWRYFYPIAEAMREAAKDYDVRIRWGGCWTVLNDTVKPAVELVADYCAEKRKMGRKPFTDGPHFEIIG